jgi:uncharacterized membrane protein
MNEPTSAREPAPCWACRRPIDPGDPYCRWCGKRQQTDTHWYFQPGWIVLMTLTVLGPFTLPLVWRSPALTRRQRWGLTLFIVVLTALVIYFFYLLVVLALNWFGEVNRVSRETL